MIFFYSGHIFLHFFDVFIYVSLFFYFKKNVKISVNMQKSSKKHS